MNEENCVAYCEETLVVTNPPEPDDIGLPEHLFVSVYDPITVKWWTDDFELSCAECV